MQIVTISPDNAKFEFQKDRLDYVLSNVCALSSFIPYLYRHLTLAFEISTDS